MSEEKNPYIGWTGRITGGNSCTIHDVGSSYATGTENTYSFIGTPTNKVSEDEFFIDESLKLDGELILKYSPVDFKWKIYNQGKYDKISNIKLSGEAKTKLYSYNGKTIGVLIVSVVNTKIEDDVFLISNN